MQCPGLQHPAVRAFVRHQKATKQRQCGVDPGHRCLLGTCRYWQVPRQQIYVCTTSLHLHICSNKGCALAEVQHDRSGTGFSVCPLSGLEMNAREFVAGGPDKVSGRGGVRWMQTGTRLGSTSRRRRSAVPKIHAVISDHTIQHMLLTIAQAQKYTLKNTIARVMRKTPVHCPFSSIMSAIIVATGLSKLAPPPPNHLVRRMSTYCTAMLPVVVTGTRHYSVNTLIAVVLSLLACGLTANSVEIFPVEAWPAQYAPPLPLYSAVASLQCRSMSACTRALKKVLFCNGVVLPAYVFPRQ